MIRAIPRAAAALLLLVLLTGADRVRVESPSSDDGRHLAIRWTGGEAALLLRRVVPPGYAAEATSLATGIAAGERGGLLAVDFLYPTPGPIAGLPRQLYRPIDATAAPIAAQQWLGAWQVVAVVDGPPAEPIVDEVDPEGRYVYAVLPGERGAAPDVFVGLGAAAELSAAASPSGSWFNRRLWMHAALIGLIGASLFVFTYLARRRSLFVRRLPGVDAIEDAVGRSTEMGRPILYVTGVEKTEDIQTIASILILGHVAEIAASYETDLRVANAYPLTMVIAEEVVRRGYANAGRLDAHRPEDVMFITSEQFAFAAAVNGMMVRERPATNIFFGRFYAESLMLAETGYLTGAVQIAGTAELTQLPFFISACDFTLIGEELFACSAYLTREPNQIAMLKAGDLLKLVIAVLVVVGAALATAQALGADVPFTIDRWIP